MRTTLVTTLMTTFLMGSLLCGNGRAAEPPKDVDAALAAGQIVTAGRLATESVRGAGRKDLNVLYRAADVAAMAGAQSLALSRFRAFVKQSSEKGPRMQRALDYLLARGVYLDGLTKYLETLGADARIWKMSTDFVKASFDDDLPEQAVETIELLIKHYGSDPAKMNELASRIGSSSFRFGKGDVLGVRFANVMATMSVTNDNSLQHGLQITGSALDASDKLACFNQFHKTLKRPLSWSLAWFSNINDLPESQRPAAAKAFLALEPIYRDQGTPAEYRSYLLFILKQSYFHVKDHELVSTAQMQQRIELLVAKLKGQPDVREQLSEPFNYFMAYLSDNAGRAAFLQKHIALPSNDRFRDLVNATEGKQLTTQLKQWAQGKSKRELTELEFSLMSWYNRLENKAGLLNAARAGMLAKLGRWDVRQVLDHVMGSKVASADDKVALLKAVHAAEGSSKSLRELVDQAEKRDKTLATHAGFKRLKAALKQDKLPGDPAYRAYLALKAIKENSKKPPAAVYATAEAFLKSYKGKVPGSEKDAATAEEYLANRVLEMHSRHVRDNAEEIGKALKLWGVRVTSPGKNFDNLMLIATPSQLWAMAPRYLAWVKQGQPLNMRLADRLSYCSPKGESVFLFDGMVDKLGETALLYLNHHMNSQSLDDSRWPLAFYSKQVSKVLAVPGTTYSQRELDWCLSVLFNYSTPEVPVPEPLLNALTDALLAVNPQAVEETSLALVYGCLVRSERHAEACRWVDRLMKKLAKRPVSDRLNAALGLFTRFPGDAESRAYVLLTVVKPLLDALPPAEQNQIVIDYSALQQCQALAVQKEDEEQAKAAQVLNLRLSELVLSNAKIVGRRDIMGPYLPVAFVEMIEAGAWPQVLRLMDRYTTIAVEQRDWNKCRLSYVDPVVAAMEKQEAYEMLYTFASLMQARVTGGRETAVRELAAVKSRAAGHIEGLLPVDKGNPTYDLYLAAQMLSLGIETQAWELTQPKLELLRKEWVSLDIGYVAWAIDQMRKQKLYKPALDFAFTVLLKELDYEAEPIARISLSKGDVYRDQENFQGARIEYQGLLDNGRYKKTRSGRMARYRLIELMIKTKDYAGAEARLQRLVDIGTLRDQAEAYFFYAMIAFDQKEYALARDQLKEVFRREHGHVEGRLLEGELRLLLPRGLASTEVPIGRLDLQTVAVPGRELTLKLQDRNLSIARGGKAIPVVVTTTRGGDQEQMKLLVSPDDETLFSGTIVTRLGVPTKNNLVLEVMGDEHVSYQMDPAFQKVNDLAYPPKLLLVKSDAELVASAGEILSREAREKAAMEQRMRRQKNSEVSAWQRQSRDKMVRPGSPIHVQVTDYDRDVSAQPDSVAVDLETSSGDLLEAFVLTETAAHSGVFTATVSTAMPYPSATASDSEEGRDANTIINTTRPEPWTSVADAKQGKWLEVDTMTSYNVTSVSLASPDTSKIRNVRLFGSLSEELDLLAEFPPRQHAAEGGVLVEMLEGSSLEKADQIRTAIRRKASMSFTLPQPDFYRPETKIGKKQGWYVTRMSGTFWLPENRYLTLKFLQEKTQSNWQHAHLLIDGEYVMGGCIQGEEILARTSKRFLSRGAHRLEVLFRDHWDESRIVVGSQQEDGSYAPLPAEWFSVAGNPELARIMQQRATITRTNGMFTAIMAEPLRLRRLRWVFDLYDGQSLSATAMTVVDDTGATVIPSAHDFTMGKANRVLEVAAGDKVAVSYTDEQRLNPDQPQLTAQLGASFFNASVKLLYEETTLDANGDMRSRFISARRARVGDRLMINITDYDEDLSDERDVVEVTVTTTSGEKLVMKALETKSLANESDYVRTGRFMQILNFGDKTADNTIKLQDGDSVEVAYVDRENTVPGVPVERTYTAVAAGSIPPSIDLYLTHIEQVEDKSPGAKVKAERLRRQGMTADEIHLYSDVVLGELSAGSDQALVSSNKASLSSAPLISARGPILIEVLHPSFALHNESRCEIVAVAESERVAAAAEGRAVSELVVPLSLHSLGQVARAKGFTVRLTGKTAQQGKTLLAEGRFAGVVRLQLGSPGDKVDDRVRTDVAAFGVGQAQARNTIDDARYRVPTLVVAGNDQVHLSLRDEAGTVLTSRHVQLQSDGRVQLMDRSYSVPVEAIHLGQKFYVQVTDPDCDISDEREHVEVAVAVAQGDAITLSLKETLPHSGIFSGTLQPLFVDKDEQGKVLPPDTGDDDLQVQFGQSLQFTYTDPISLRAAGTTNVTVSGRIQKGADARMATFSKEFKDPEMAVKTRFLLAEALFEIAKDQRKLKNVEDAAESIGRGKRILEEAMRDYPDTSLVAQGEFLLANLAQELESYQEAIGRYSRVISSWPDSEYASRSQFKKAICLEQMEHYEQSCEAYVKLTYLYPNSPLVADATVRLGNYYYTHKRYDTAGRIFERFQERHPDHALAAKSLFLAGQSYMKMENEKTEGSKRDYSNSIFVFERLIESYPDDNKIRPEGMYWLGESYFKNRDHVRAYQTFKKLTWDYPSSKWAKIARGRLTEEAFESIEQ